jgi:hypothetical protein
MKRTPLQFILPVILILVSCNAPGPALIAAFTATPSEKISTSPGVESTALIPGDLGFGKISGKVTDSVSGAPPRGARFRLKADYDISNFPSELQVILQAMKTYGIMLADNGSNWYVTGAPDER